MKKFLVLYNSSVSARDQMAKSTPEQMKAGLESWMAWGKKAQGAIVDFGAPLAPASGSSKATGFSILQADSAEKLQALLADHPHRKAPGASIDVLELLPTPGSQR
jgi:hypothetical protein